MSLKHKARNSRFAQKMKKYAKYDAVAKANLNVMREKSQTLLAKRKEFEISSDDDEDGIADKCMEGIEVEPQGKQDGEKLILANNHWLNLLTGTKSEVQNKPEIFEEAEFEEKKILKSKKKTKKANLKQDKESLKQKKTKKRKNDNVELNDEKEKELFNLKEIESDPIPLIRSKCIDEYDEGNLEKSIVRKKLKKSEEVDVTKFMRIDQTLKLVEKPKMVEDQTDDGIFSDSDDDVSIHTKYSINKELSE